MTSESDIKRSPLGWEVHVRWGRSVEVYGPYRWRWVAGLVARIYDGHH